MSVATDITRRELHMDAVAFRSDEDAEAARARVDALLKRPLSADAAVQIALLNNRGLQGAYNALGIAEAVRVRQSLPPNPSVTISRVTGTAETEIDRQIVDNILALVTLPARSEIAADRFRQAQLNAALATLRTAAEARRAYFRAVAARELTALLTQAESAAATSAELAKRLAETGAMNKIDLARERAFHAEVQNQLARARQLATSEREKLVRLLGLSGNEKLALPDALPPFPKHARSLRGIEQEALNRRVDLQMARIELDTLAKSYGLTKATRFVNVLEAGYADKITKDKTSGERIVDRGFTLTFEVPLFDFGEARVREAEQTYMQAVNRAAELAINVRSQAREAYGAYRASYDIAARYQHDVLPLRKTISDEMMLRYGAMQVDVFSLLNDARQHIAATVAATEARRDFWIAGVDLSTAVAGGGAGEMAAGEPATATAENAGAH